MAAGDLVVDDWQVEFRGLLTGGETAMSLVQVEGLMDLPAVRSADQALLRQHGTHPGDDFTDARSIVLTYELYAATDAIFAALVTAMQTAFRPGGDEQPMVLRIPGVAAGAKALIWCRPKRRQLPVNLEWLYRIPIATIELVATDPLVYAHAEQTGQSTLPTSGGGLAFPLVYPRVYGAVSTGGTILAVNTGSFDTYPTLRIDGPATNPRIENLTAGKTIAIDIVLASGEFLVIDTKARTVLLNGTASRYSSLTTTSRWFTLAPGVNELRFRASTGTAATLNLSFRSAWI